VRRVRLSQQHDGDIGEWEEAEVEGVGERRRRRRGAAERLDREDDVADRPREQRGAEHQRHSPAAPAVERLEQTQAARERLDRVDAPAVEPGRVLVVRVLDQEAEICGQQDRDQRVGDPHGARASSRRARCAEGAGTGSNA
jgi:hypothetical protein